MQLSLLASTPDIATTGYMVNLLLGTPGLVAAEAKALGYDGIEFFPGPPGTVGVAEMDRALKACDVALTAVDSGRIVAAGLTLLHPDPAIRSRALNRLCLLGPHRRSPGPGKQDTVLLTVSGGKLSVLLCGSAAVLQFESGGEQQHRSTAAPQNTLEVPRNG